jgi:predicted MFS family arabinose efflux permease
MRTLDFSFTSLRQLLFTSEIYRAWRSLVVAIGLHLLLQFSGISGIFYYSNLIFEKNLGLPPDTVSGLSAGLGAINWIATLSSIILVERYGRRTLLLTSMVVQTVMGLLICIFIPTKIYLAFLVSIYLYVAAFATGLGCLPWIIMAELVSIEFDIPFYIKGSFIVPASIGVECSIGSRVIQLVI